MSTISSLTNELNALISETKRKDTELRQASDASLAELKALHAQFKDEQATLTALSTKPHFTAPFVIACSSRSAKIAMLGVQGLHRLINARIISVSSIPPILDAFYDALNISSEIQVRILQSIQALMQYYSNNIFAGILERLLAIAFNLQHSKVTMVVNSAAATLQQLLISVFDKVARQDKQQSSSTNTSQNSNSNNIIVELDNSNKISLSPTSYDAYCLFNDLVLISQSRPSVHMRFITSIPEAFSLELIETVLQNFSSTIMLHPEQIFIIKNLIAPWIIRIISERNNFPILVRATRIAYIIIRRLISILSAECEVILSLLINLLDSDSTPIWKRVLFLEVFQGICSEYDLILSIYSEYDAQEGRKNIFISLTNSFSRISTDRPRNEHSSSHTKSATVSALSSIMEFAEGYESDSKAVDSMLSSSNSAVKVPNIDQLDKSDPPTVPSTYMLYLILTIMNSLSEGMNVFITPLSLTKSNSSNLSPSSKTSSSSNLAVLTSTKSNSRRLKREYSHINPLKLENHPQKEKIVETTKIIENCWPAILSAYSVYLGLNMDSELLHTSLRAFQKFTQVAGILYLETPCDAFLTTLSNIAIPASMIPLQSQSYISPATNNSSNSGNYFSSKIMGLDSSSQSQYLTKPLTLRNLMCLRALTNLGISLGPILGSSWSIILSALQRAEMVISSFNSSLKNNSFKKGRGSRNNSISLKSDAQILTEPTSVETDFNLATEISLYENSSKRLFDATKNFSNRAFLDLLSTLCNMANVDSNKSRKSDASNSQPSSNNSKEEIDTTVSLTVAQSRLESNEVMFALEKINFLIEVNLTRLLTVKTDTSGWDILTTLLIHLTTSPLTSYEEKVMSSNVFSSLIEQAFSASQKLSKDEKNANEIEDRIFSIIKVQSIEIHAELESTVNTVHNKSNLLEIMNKSLVSLNKILNQCEGSFMDGWIDVFSIISISLDFSEIFEFPSLFDKYHVIVQTGFLSVQLICNDFLPFLETNNLKEFINLLLLFCKQKSDINISFTAISFFWSISDHIMSKTSSTDGIISDLSSKCSSYKDLHSLYEKEVDVDSNSSNALLSLWIILLYKLVLVCEDPRPQVRNAAIPIIFRTFETYGSQLASNNWYVLIKVIIEKIMLIRPVIISVESHKLEIPNWSETFSLILEGIGNLFVNFSLLIYSNYKLEDFLNSVFQYFTDLLKYSSASISVSVFKCFSQILDSIKVDKIVIPKSLVLKIWNLWESSSNSALIYSEDLSVELTYIKVFPVIVSIMGSEYSQEKIKTTLNILKKLVSLPYLPLYVSDATNMTPLQKNVMASIRFIPLDLEGMPSLLLRFASDFSILAFKPLNLNEKSAKEEKSRTSTYFALTLSSFELIRYVFNSASDKSKFFFDKTIVYLVNNLAVPIAQTSAGQKLVIRVEAMRLLLELTRYYYNNNNNYEKSLVTDFHDAIAKSTCSALNSGAVLIGTPDNFDNSFDLEAINELIEILRPALENALMSSNIQKSFIETLFKHSFLFYESSAELGFKFNYDLQKILEMPLYGSTKVQPILKSYQLSLILLDELYKSVTLLSKPIKNNKLWVELIPPFLWRYGNVIHSYVIDQPIRGRLPMTRLQREELSCTLKRLLQIVLLNNKELNLEVRRLLPLIMKSISVSRNDSEILLVLEALLLKLIDFENV